jgi:hypothetical protein
MMRLALFALLGCSFLTVQAHAVRERIRANPGSGLQLTAQSLGRSGCDPRVTGLGGGTTRALQESADPRWAAATPALAPRLPGHLSSSQAGLAPLDVPPVPGAAPPILRI